MEKKSGFQMSRRSFLKANLACAGAAAVGGGLGLGSSLTHSAQAAEEDNAKWVKQFCGSCIWTNCATEMKIVNGVAVELRGNKDHPANQGSLCPRGAAQLMNLYNPYRCKNPMKRTNPEKGLDIDPGWVEITWEEAMDTVMEKLQAIQDTDPRKLLFMYGFAGNLHETPFVKIFNPVMGTPNYAMSCGPLCEVHHAPALFHATFVDRVDAGRCNYVLSFGRNLGGSAMFASGPGRAMADAIERGMKVVMVDPHAGPDASKGEWVPIRPGTDMAMGMAIIHVMLLEMNTYDVEAMKDRSNAPYFVRANGDYAREPQSQKPVMFDLADNQLKTYDDPTLTDPALDGEYDVYGEKLSTCFTYLKNLVKDATPEWAEEITAVPAADIRRITKEFVEAACIGSTIDIEGETFPYRPACVGIGRGAANNMQGMRFYIVADIINLLVGAIGVPGSLLRSESMKYLFEDGMMREYPIAKFTTEKDAAFKIPGGDYTGRMFYPLARFPVLGFTMNALVDPEKYHLDHKIEAFFPYGANPFINDASKEVTVEAMKKIPFIFTMAYHLDEMSMFADIILPESAHAERYLHRPVDETMTVGLDTVALYGVNYQEPAVERLYNTRQYDDVFIEMTDRLGFTAKRNAIYNGFYKLKGEFSLIPPKKYTYPEMLDIVLKNFTQDASKGADYFRDNNFMMKNWSLPECYEYHFFKGKGRLPIYNWRDLQAANTLRKNLEKWQVTVPGWDDIEGAMNEYIQPTVWRPNHLTEPSEEFNMLACNWKMSPRILGLGGQDDNVWLREVVEEWDLDGIAIQINPLAAEKIGVQTGDKIVVESQHGGKLEGVVKVTNLIQVDSVGFPGQGGRVSPFMNPISKHGVNYNQLLTYQQPFFMDDNGSISVGARVKISKAGVN